MTNQSTELERGPFSLSLKENLRMVWGPKTRAMGASKDDIWECTPEFSAEVAMVSLWKQLPGCGQLEAGKGDTWDIGLSKVPFEDCQK